MLIQIFAYILIVIGLFFVVSSIVGLFRFPDFYTKMHAAGVADSFGLQLCLLGFAMMQTSLISAIKIIAIMALFFVLSPTANHLLAKAAYLSKLKPYKKE